MSKGLRSILQLAGVSLAFLILPFNATVAGVSIGADGKLASSDSTFDCISRLQAVRGFYAATKDWECFGCHIKVRPEWDLVCETGHGCDPIPPAPAKPAAE
jgi:hypothetical protein